MKLGITLLRATVGAISFAHGAQKLFGWFGGHGPDATGQALESMGMKPGKRHALLAGAAEAGGGTLLATGLLTPLGAASVIGVMDQAVRSVHKEKGFFVTEGGYEYNLVLVVAALAIVDSGPGPLSLDRALGTERSGALWALAALGAGLAGPRILERLSAAEEDAPAPAESPRFQREPALQPEPEASSSPSA